MLSPNKSARWVIQSKATATVTRVVETTEPISQTEALIRAENGIGAYTFELVWEKEETDMALELPPGFSFVLKNGKVVRVLEEQTHSS
jgi:DNA/RNA endonuclease YhcR with UshA esterase domain